MNSNAFDSSLNSADGLSSGSNRAEFADNKREILNLDAMYQVTDNSQLRVELSGSNVALGRTNSLGALQNSEYETKSGKMTYEVDSNLGLIKANVYANFLDWDYQSTLGSSFSKADQSVFVAQLEDTIELNPQHTVRFGVEYRDNQMESPDLMVDGAEISYDVYAASGMWNWSINDNLSWTNALRLDHLDLDHNGVFSSNAQFTKEQYDTSLTDFSYNSGFVYKPTGADTLRLFTSRGLEVPSLLELGLAWMLTTVRVT